MARLENRRPLASRNTAWARRLTGWLAATRVTPNQISMAGMGFAALAGLCFYAGAQAEGLWRIALLLAAAAGCQLRLICNLMDGLVAIEAGRQTEDGPFWNEFPDRVSDILILTGVGLGVGLPALGWAAASLSVLTAYTRELGRASGLPPDYRGLMAKPQRMAVLTGAAALALFEPLWSGNSGVLHLALWLVCIGCVVTVLRRAQGIISGLRRITPQ